MQFPTKTMSQTKTNVAARARWIEDAIASPIAVSSPKPAAIGLVYFWPKSLTGWALGEKTLIALHRAERLFGFKFRFPSINLLGAVGAGKPNSVWSGHDLYIKSYLSVIQEGLL
jgi:hypothetical protein